MENPSTATPLVHTGAETTMYGTLDADGIEQQQEQELKQSQQEELLTGKARFRPDCLLNRKSWVHEQGHASISSEILNLLKNIVGSGGLSLSAGIGEFGNAPSAIVPSLLLILLMSIANSFSFSLIGRVCAIQHATSYQQAWHRSVGKMPSLIASIVIVKALLGTWATSIMIASTWKPLLEWSLGIQLTRNETLIGITTVCLLPLCFSNTLSSLVRYSLMGQVATVWTIISLILRYVDGSYAPGGHFYDQQAVIPPPLFGKNGWNYFFTPNSLILVSILSTGFIAHYNAPRYVHRSLSIYTQLTLVLFKLRFYFELKDHTTGRFNVVSNCAFGLAALTYGLVSSLGFLTFGSNCQAFLLDNYARSDILINGARFGVGVSMITSYPLLFMSGRDGILEFWKVDRRILTILLLALITSLALKVDDLTFVLSLGGSTLSTMLVYVLPVVMFRSTIIQCTCLQTARSCRELQVATAMMVVGIVMGLLGVAQTIQRSFFDERKP